MPRRSYGLLLAGVALIVFGIVGMTVSGLVLREEIAERSSRFGDQAMPFHRDRWFPQGERRLPTEFESNGERIFFTGVGRDGPIEIEWDFEGRGMFMPRRRGGRTGAPMGCAMCHGADGRGASMRGMAETRAPDIRYSTLTAERQHDGETLPAYSDQDIARAVRRGTTPDGDPLDPLMPRWNIDDPDMADLVEHLKELDRR